MKRTFTTLCILALFFTAHSNQADEGRGAVPESWKVTHSHLVENFKNTEAEFVFHFRTVSNAQLKKRTVRFSYNGTEEKLTTDSTGLASLKLKPGKYLFEFYYNSEYLEITTDSIEIKPAHRSQVEICFAPSDKPMLMRKPVIYLYPQQPTDVQIELKTIHPFSFTYPTYGTDSLNAGWKIKAYPNGTLEQDGKKFGYIFWEAPSAFFSPPYKQPGFVVNKNELVAFFEEKLGHIGLNSREIQDFVTYWVPEMQTHENVYLNFIFDPQYNVHAHLKVSPQPDQMIRLMMLWEPCDANEKASITMQELPKFERKGFTLVEWGGTRVERFIKDWNW